jgi:Ca2+-binding EF-hand superfamily protein
MVAYYLYLCVSVELFDQFSALDINENRHLSRKELSLILNTMDTDALDKFIAQVDTDDDHQIDKHELNQMLEYQDTTSPSVTAAPMMLSESVSGPDLFKTVTKSMATVVSTVVYGGFVEIQRLLLYTGLPNSRMGYMGH